MVQKDQKYSDKDIYLIHNILYIHWKIINKEGFSKLNDRILDKNEEINSTLFIKEAAKLYENLTINKKNVEKKFYYIKKSFWSIFKRDRF